MTDPEVWREEPGEQCVPLGNARRFLCMRDLPNRLPHVFSFAMHPSFCLPDARQTLPLMNSCRHRACCVLSVLSVVFGHCLPEERARGWEIKILCGRRKFFNYWVGRDSYGVWE